MFMLRLPSGLCGPTQLCSVPCISLQNDSNKHPVLENFIYIMFIVLLRVAVLIKGVKLKYVIFTHLLNCIWFDGQTNVHMKRPRHYYVITNFLRALLEYNPSIVVDLLKLQKSSVEKYLPIEEMSKFHYSRCVGEIWGFPFLSNLI